MFAVIIAPGNQYTHSSYLLKGGVFSRNPRQLEDVMRCRRRLNANGASAGSYRLSQTWRENGSSLTFRRCSVLSMCADEFLMSVSPGTISVFLSFRATMNMTLEF